MGWAPKRNNEAKGIKLNMKRLAKSLIVKLLDAAGYKISRKEPAYNITPVEFNQKDSEIMRYVLSKKLTMTSPQRVIATIQSCKYVIENKIEGDFVECGVWRGGNSIAAKLIFEAYGSDKRVILFDTFAGMTAPTDADKAVRSGESAHKEFVNAQRDGYNDWCYASLEDVERNFKEANVDLSSVKFVKGDVLETLAINENLPLEISVLRLDTDWYESTRMEMNTLYPLLVDRGAFLADDYGHWDGARKAIEEFFKESGRLRPLLQYTDYTGRMGVKC